jgi:hypothetical protein
VQLFRLRAGVQKSVDIERTLCGSEVCRSTKGKTMLRSVQKLKKVSVHLIRQAVKASPRFGSTEVLNRKDEIGLSGHYQRATYWEQEPRLYMAIHHERFDR